MKQISQTDYQERLRSLGVCLQALYDDCENQDWQSLAIHEAQRVSIVQELQSFEADKSESTQAFIVEIIQLHKKIIDLMNKTKNDSESELLNIKRTRKKSAFYQ